MPASVLLPAAVSLIQHALPKGTVVSDACFSDPPDSALGDLAFACFSLAKDLKSSPAEIATKLAADVSVLLTKEKKPVFSGVTASGPYLNFTVSDGHLLSLFTAKNFSALPTKLATKHRKKTLVEYANPNTHKDVHVGHLRNFTLGAAIVRLLDARGHKVVPASYINDLGNNVAKCLWGMKHIQADDTVAPGEEVRTLDKAYVEANARAEADPAVREEISNIQRTLEAYLRTGKGAGEWVTLWKKTRKWSIAALDRVFAEFDLPIKKRWYESELIAEADALVRDLQKKGIAKESQGAVIVDLEDEKLGVNLLRKTDGTLLYNAKDLALAEEKERSVHPDESLYIVDARQSLALQQLFATLKRMGKKEHLVHLSYEFVTLPEGAMSSRKGNVIFYEDFRDGLIARAEKEVRERHADWSDVQVRTAAHAIAFGGLVFALLKQDREKKIVFNVEEAVSFDGFTGPYLQYTLARISSVEKKAGGGGLWSNLEIPKTVTLSSVEHRLALELLEVADAVRLAADTYRPSVLCQALFSLCQTFSEFYEKEPILNAPPELRGLRLAFLAKIRVCLLAGFGMLGLPVVDEM